MHKLAAGEVSVDTTVIVDFHLAGRLALFGELFSGRLLISDLVVRELTEANIQLSGAQTVTLSTSAEWDFLGNVRRRRPGLGIGEVSAITVACFRGATLLTNDRQARESAEEFKLPVCGVLDVLEYATATARLSAPISANTDFDEGPMLGISKLPGEAGSEPFR